MVDSDDSMTILNDNQLILDQKLSNVEALLKDALTPQGAKEAEQKKRPLTIEDYEQLTKRQKQEEAKENAARLAHEQNAQISTEELSKMEDYMVNLLDERGVELTSEYQDLFDLWVVKEMERAGKDAELQKDHVKFFQTVRRGVKDRFNRILKLDLNEDELEDFVEEETKWKSKKKVDSVKKPSSMTLTGKSVAVAQKSKGEVEGYMEMLEKHNDKSATLSIAKMYEIKDRIKKIREESE